MRTIAVVGAGVIGLSWARLAREQGWNVVVYDPRPDLNDVVAEFADDEHVRATADLADAVSGADLVQENGPERLEVKRNLFSDISKAAKPDAVLATSSSSLTASLIGAELPDAARLIVGHPFNPPELMPLVEVLPGERTSQETTDRAVSLYEELGRVPVVVRKELPGFVANRLQTAVSREAQYLVQQGVVTAAELDTIVQNSLGLRWATIGLFEGNVLGGGPGGIRHLFAGVGAETGKIEHGTPSRDPEVVEALLEQVENTYGVGADAYKQLSEKRDERTRAVLRALRAP